MSGVGYGDIWAIYHLWLSWMLNSIGTMGSWPWKFSLGPVGTQLILMMKGWPGSLGDSSRSHRPASHPLPWEQGGWGGTETELECVAIIKTPCLALIPHWHFSTESGWHPWLIRMLCQNKFFSLKKERFLPKRQSQIYQVSPRKNWLGTSSKQGIYVLVFRGLGLGWA